MDVEHQAVRGGHTGQVAASRVDDALGLSRRARRVEDVEHVFGVHRRDLGFDGLVRDQVVVPDVVVVVPVDVLPGASDDDAVLDGGALSEGSVGVVLQGHGGAHAPGAVLGDENLGLGVLDPVAEGVGGEATEDD